MSSFQSQTLKPADALAASAQVSNAPLRSIGAAPEKPPEHPLLSCLSILAGLLERPISAQALSSGLPITDGAFSPELFVRAAGRAGISARLAKRKLKQISALNLPCVLLLKGGDACVLTAFKGQDEVEVIRPGKIRGSARLKLSDLAAQQSGRVLFAKAEYRFDDRTEELGSGSRLHWFWSALVQFWKVYAHVIIASLVINLFALASPLFFMNVYDRVVPNNATETLWVLALGVAGVFGFDFALRTTRAYFVDAAGKSADVILASRVFAHLLGMKFEARPPSTGALASNLREYESLREFFTSATLVAFADLPFVFLFIGVIWLIAGPVALVPLAALPVVIIIGLIIQLPLNRVVRKALRESFQKHATLIESIEGLDTIKIAGAEGRAQRNWEQFVGYTAKSSMSARLLSTLAMHLSLLVQNMVTVMVIIVGVFRIGDGLMTTGALVAASLLSSRAMAPLGQVASLMVRLQQSIVSLGSLDKLMQTPLERPPGKVFLHRPSFRGQIEFRDVVFRYPNQSTAALNGISFFVGAGEKVGLIGRIGSGKSTIARLIVGLYQPVSGSILLDGADLRQIDPADLRRNIGYAPQDPFLFFGSVKENISLGASHADHEAILRAATISGVDDFLKRQPEGFDLAVGERGQYLSGGQREAVAIARALLSDPPLLLMDEPTGAMDNASEGRLKARLAQILAEKTMLLVTHRSSMLPLVDRLIVVDGGRIVADGTKEKVLEALGRGNLRVPD